MSHMLPLFADRPDPSARVPSEAAMAKLREWVKRDHETDTVEKVLGGGYLDSPSPPTYGDLYRRIDAMVQRKSPIHRQMMNKLGEVTKIDGLSLEAITPRSPG